MNASAGLSHYARLFGQPQRMRGLDRASLPSPAAYLAQRGIHATRPRGDWVSICCPVHKGGDEQHPSMGVSVVDGHFCCHACGVKGGDIVALHRLVTGLGFRDAVLDLGGRFHD